MSNPLHVLEITTAQIKFSSILAYACTIPGTLMCFAVLVAYGIAASFPKSRSQLDRVSFRLLTYALIFNVLFGIAFSVTASLTGPGTLCNFGAFAVNLTLNFSTFFTFCIALNLQLVLVHHVNGKMMEKYYVIVTTILSLALTVPAYGLDQFGWDAQNDTCWFKNPSSSLRLRWLVGTQSFWILLVATGETLCSSIVIYYMVRFELDTQNILRASQRSNNTSMTSSTNNSGSGTYWSRSSTSSRTTLAQAGKYRGIIMRIALYPIVSLIMNFSTVALDLNQTIQGIHTQLDFRLLVLDLCLYGFRTAAYAVLAAFDPSFVRAFRTMRDTAGGGDQPSKLKYHDPRFAPGNTSDILSTIGQLTVNVELQDVSQSDEAITRDKFVKFDDPYQRPDRLVNDDVQVSSGRLSTRADAVRRAQADVNMEVEEDRNFERQL